MSHLNLALLGPVEITLDRRTTAHFRYAKVQALLVYLAVEAGRAHSQALAELRRTIHDREAEPPFLLSTRDTIQLNPVGSYALDVAGFVGLIAACKNHPHTALEACAACVALRACGRLVQTRRYAPGRRESGGARRAGA